MTDTQQGHAELIALLRKMEAGFKQEREFIQQHRPDKQVGDFPSLDGIETMSIVDLEIRKVMCWAAVRGVEQSADDVQAEVDEAQSKLPEKNLTDVEALKRAVYHLAARVTKLEGERSGRPLGLPHVSRTDVPQFLGMPSGLGRHGVTGPVGSGGGARKLGVGDSASAPDAMGAGNTHWPHPLDVIGPSRQR
jgi:hypothetical protein